jgi:hypothetical protein
MLSGDAVVGSHVRLAAYKGRSQREGESWRKLGRLACGVPRSDTSLELQTQIGCMEMQKWYQISKAFGPSQIFVALVETWNYRDLFGDRWRDIGHFGSFWLTTALKIHTDSKAASVDTVAEANLGHWTECGLCSGQSRDVEGSQISRRGEEWWGTLKVCE